MSITELKSAYRNLSANEKLNIWMDKFNDVLSQGQLTNDERTYINQLQDKLSLGIFETGVDLQALLNEINQWTQEVQSNLGWTEQQAIVMTSTLFTPTEFSARIVYKGHLHTDTFIKVDNIYKIIDSFINIQPYDS